MKPDASADTRWLDHQAVSIKMLLAFGLLLLIVVGNTVAFFAVQTKDREAKQWTIHTYEVLNGIERLRTQALSQQTGLRGYRLAGEDRFLVPYREGEAGFVKHLAQLRFLVRDNPAQRTHVEEIERVMATWQTEIAKPLIALPLGPENNAAAVRLVDRGKPIFDTLKEKLGEMQVLEKHLLEERTATLHRTEQMAAITFAVLLLAGIALVLVSLRLVHSQIAAPLAHITDLMTRLSGGEKDIPLPPAARRDEIGALARALGVFKRMVGEADQQAWVKSHAAEIASRLQAASDLDAYAASLTASLAPLLGAGVAAFHVADAAGETLELAGGYGMAGAAARRQRFGEGLVGQCAVEKKRIVVEGLPKDYLRVTSGMGAAAPDTLLLLPIANPGRVLGVVELGRFGRFGAREEALIAEIAPLVALSLDNLQRALRTQELLQQSRKLGEELQASSEELRVQQEELRTTNESLHAKSRLLEEQSAKLLASEEELRVQSEELQVSNQELRQKGAILEAQKQTLEALQADTQQKAEELERASQYKSEFLANMSHELRTPLNSLLILSRGLADNEEGHLSADEVESATVIHESGSNLLRLINDILDLSKVEAGKMELVLETVSLAAFGNLLTRNFKHVARQKNLDFSVEIAADAPASIETDGGKLEQILKNLLSNAFKFTREGAVRVYIGAAPAGMGREGDVALCVSDTGVGIPPDKQHRVFQAFEQADGSTSRQFGGTGLGLSIARSMANLMGGEIRLDSVEGEGSTFTLLLPASPGLARPATTPADEAPRTPVRAAPALPPEPTLTSPPPQGLRAAAVSLPDDRNSLKPGDVVILIVEDDPAFARVLMDLVHKRGYRALHAGDGEEGLKLAREFAPTGILLDVMLPGMDGFAVIEKLKADRATRHLPVHFISATDDQGKGLDLGAVGFLTKPVTKEGLSQAFERLLHFAAGSTRRVLVVDDDSAARLAVRRLIGGEQVEVAEAASGAEALALLHEGSYDCVILDLGMSGMDGFEFLERAASLPARPPVVVYSGRDLTAEETLKLRQYTDSIVIKGARSPERLLDEVSLFLHSIRTLPPAPVREADKGLAGLAGRTVLVVDDDMRNIFALSKALRAKGLTVVMAQDGLKAIKQLDENKAIELVLMDIMMPGMDGYETMAAIRKDPRHRSLPMIALTAKAMQGDREKCLEAGANDYLSKPIDLDKLFSMMQVWLAAH